MKIFSIAAEWMQRRGHASRNDDPVWISDPLRHPALAAMDERALADLPMPRRLPPLLIPREAWK